MGGAAKPRGAPAWPRAGPTSTTCSARRRTDCRERRAALDRACEAEGRDPATLPLSLMAGFVIGADEADLRERAATRMAEWRRHATRSRRRGC